jgi:hypothetical protein
MPFTSTLKIGWRLFLAVDGAFFALLSCMNVIAMTQEHSLSRLLPAAIQIGVALYLVVTAIRWRIVVTDDAIERRNLSVISIRFDDVRRARYSSRGITLFDNTRQLTVGSPLESSPVPMIETLRRLESRGITIENAPLPETAP